MTIDFVKYSGTGNDFILIDDRKEFFPSDNLQLISALCDRHFGVGSDGLMLIRESKDTDFEMIFFNPDGSKSLCGNGSRCSVHFARSLGLTREQGSFVTTDGVHHYKMLSDNEIAIDMKPPSGAEKIDDFDFLNTGSPHLIVYTDDLESKDVYSEGQRLRSIPPFNQEGTNVNFVSDLGNDKIEMRTYERGVENETLSCGTGVTAAALNLKRDELGNHLVSVGTKGGDLRVHFKTLENGFSDIWLEGPVLKIFEGVYDTGE